MVSGAWLTPTHAPLTIREIATPLTEVVDAPKAKLSVIPYPALWVVGLFDPIVRELRTTRYQFTRPFVIDSSATEATLGITPSSLEDALRGAAAAQRAIAAKA